MPNKKECSSSTLSCFVIGLYGEEPLKSLGDLIVFAAKRLQIKSKLIANTRFRILSLRP